MWGFENHRSPPVSFPGCLFTVLPFLGCMRGEQSAQRFLAVIRTVNTLGNSPCLLHILNIPDRNGAVCASLSALINNDRMAGRGEDCAQHGSPIGD